MPGRTFVGFELARGAVRRLTEAREAFVTAAPDWEGEKWVSPELLHVTLKFIGPLDAGAVPEALRMLADACSKVPAAALVLREVRAVPSQRRANMVWATLADADGSCEALARAVDATLSDGFGVPVDTRRFLPHVTLARARRPRRVPAGAVAAATLRLTPGEAPVGEMSVRSLTLYESTLGRAGPVYASLGSWPVGAD